MMWLGVAALSLMLGTPMSAAEQSASTAVAQPDTLQTQSASEPTAKDQLQESDVQSLHLLVGRSLVISSPTRIKRISLADPTIAETVVINPYQIVVNGKAPGGVSLLLWDEKDQSQAFEVTVDTDALGLSAKIHALFPAESVKVETAKDAVMLSGRVSSVAVADKIIEMAKNISPKVTNLLQAPVSPAGQIMLQVRFAEVNRVALNQFGLNILSLPGAKNGGTISTQQFSPPQLVNSQNGVGSTLGLSNLLNIFYVRPDINLAATLQALQQNNVLEILAEPNLLTASGKEASFLAGGEFPFPILQSTGGSGGFAGITIQFKEFGVRLNFTPTLTLDGLIHLKVEPEVSSLDFTNALTLSGFTIPALSTRRVKSEMDLADGQSFAIAGLIDNRVTDQLSKVPGIGDIPILGKLFQSWSKQKSSDELLVVVTPHIVQPLTAANTPKGPVFPSPFLAPLNGEQAKTPKK
jgi:pilus assembly protein CpaC